MRELCQQLKDDKFEVDQRNANYVEWVTGILNVEHIMNLRKDELEKIGPSIGKPVITQTMWDMLNAFYEQLHNHGTKLDKMEKILGRGEAIRDLLDEVLAMAVSAANMVQQAKEKKPQFPHTVYLLCQRCILRKVYKIATAIQEHRFVGGVLLASLPMDG